MDTIKIGIVGFGFIGHEHEKLLRDFEEIEVKAVCDIDPIQLQTVPKEIARYEDVDTMLEEADIDTIICACNNNQHFDVVAKAARAKKNIICEKPAAMSVCEYDKMLQVVEENGVLFTVHQQRRYDCDYCSVKEVFEKGTLGKVYTIQSSLYGYNGNMHDWHVKKSEGGGMLYDWGVHLIDQILYMVPGKLKTVYADMQNVINEEVDDFFKLQLRFECGVSAEIELGTYFLKDKEGWFTRHWFMGGNKGTMYCDDFDPKGKIVKTSHLLTNVPGSRPMGAEGPTRSFGTPIEGLICTEEIPQFHYSFANYFKNYVAARQGKEDFLVKSDEVRRCLSVMEACRKSAQLGRSVDFES